MTNVIFRDRFLFGILIGIGVLVVVALILFFTRNGQLNYGEETTPSGVLRNYVLAIQKQDYIRAYGYLASSSTGLTAFEQFFLNGQAQVAANTVLEIGSTKLDEPQHTAIVQVFIIGESQNIFGQASSAQEAATLVQQNGVWKITSVPYPFGIPGLIIPEPARPLPVSTPPPLPTTVSP